MREIKTQVCVLGAGAGGIGCAYRLIKNGISTVIVDKNEDQYLMRLERIG